MVSLDKSLTPQLGFCRALWSCIETTAWIFNLLVPIEVHYMEKNPEMFSSKKKEKLKIFTWRKKDMNILHGVSKLSVIFILEVN